MKLNALRSLLLLFMALITVFTLAACELPAKGSLGENRPNSESAIGGGDISLDGEGDGNFSGGGINFGGEGDGGINFSGGGDGSVVVGGEGTLTFIYRDGVLMTLDGNPVQIGGGYTVENGQVILSNGAVLGQVEVVEGELTEGETVEDPNKEEDPYAGMVWVPVSTYVPEDQVVTLEDGTRWIKYEDEYYCVHEDDSFSNVTFYTEEHEQTTRDKAQLIVLWVYHSDETGWKALKHAEYDADETCHFSTTYHLEELDGELCYVSSQTMYYDNGTAYVGSEEEYDPSLGMYYPTKIYTFNNSGDPDGHFEKDYYTDGTTKASRGYYPNGNPSYDYRYNEAGIMVEDFYYNEQGAMEGHTIRDDAGDPIISTYYRDDGRYYTVEPIENGTRYTYYDAYGNVTEIYDSLNG